MNPDLNDLVTPAPADTLMRREALEAGDAVERLLRADADRCAALAEQLVRQPPQGLLTLARGSSDHAAHYMAYLVMARLGRLVTSLPMSLVTLYQSQIQCDGLVSWGFSQSGQSPDLVAPTRFFREGGARTGGEGQRLERRVGGAARRPAVSSV